MPEYNFDDLPGIKGKQPPGLLHRNGMHAGVMYPRRAWKEAGGYPEEFSDGREDWAFNVALGRIGYCGVHVHEALYIYRREGQNRSLTNTNPVDHERFKDKIKKQFPDMYGEEKLAMACCGRGRARSGKQNAKGEKKVKVNTKIKAAPLNQHDDGVLLEYIGRNVGTEIWRGPVTKKAYKFGRNPRRWRCLVDERDALGLLAMRVGGANQFKRVIVPKPSAAPAPSPVTVTPPPLSVAHTITPLASDMDEPEMTQFDRYEPPADAEPEVAPEPEVSDRADGDVLLRIKGVGKKTAQLLRENGYETIADVASAGADELVEIGIDAKRAHSIVEAALEAYSEE
jgi:predicted flap endonuclease-1-like 5' DNA nuclease